MLQEILDQVTRNQVGDETTPLTAQPGPGAGPELTDPREGGRRGTTLRVLTEGHAVKVQVAEKGRDGMA